MCGIAGCSIQGLNTSEIDSLGNEFIRTLKHRGPDGHGYWFAPDTILLAHTRLSIQDLSEHGKQPMHSASGRYVISFNGEIYNFSELRAQQEKQGASFHGHSDTEVILSLVDTMGIPEALKKLDGMFAIAIFDRKSGEVTLARDRMGEKPLYYGWVGNQFFFASGLNTVRALGKKLTINSDILGDFLAFGYVPTPHSIYKSIYKLVPGTYLTLSSSELHAPPPPQFNPYADSNCGPKRYWHLETIAKTQPDLTTPASVTNQLQDCLMETIGQQLVADVPVGCFLSGGIDSTLVTALAQAQSSSPVNTFTIGFDDPQFNEAKYASELASHLGTNHHETYISSDDALGIINSLPDIYDEPFADPSQLPSVLVSRIAKEKVTVCLSGDGGDELFAGYNRYASTSFALGKLNHVPESIRKRLGRLLCNINLSWIERLLPAVKHFPGLSVANQANIAMKARKLGWIMQKTSEAEIYLFLLSFNGFQPDPEKQPDILTARISEAFSDDRDFLSTVMLLDQLNYLVDDNLVKVDRSAMSVSLETRLPLLDRKVVELSWRIDPALKLNLGQTKWPLREILYQHVPKHLIERPKMGFSVPLSRWLRKELHCKVDELLADSTMATLIDLEHYRLLWAQHRLGDRDNSLLLWPVIILLQWLKANSKYIERV